MVCHWRPPVALCPYCGAPCCRKVRGGLGKTCGSERCKRKAQGLTPEHFRRMAAAVGSSPVRVVQFQQAMSRRVV